MRVFSLGFGGERCMTEPGVNSTHSLLLASLTMDQHRRTRLDGHLLPPVHLVPVFLSLLDAGDGLKLGPSVGGADEAGVHFGLLV